MMRLSHVASRHSAMNNPLDKRPLPAKEDALAFAREMVPPSKWKTIVIVAGSTKDGGDGLLLQACDACWIITYDPYDSDEEAGEERVWVSKAAGVVVKMALEE